MSLPKTCPVSGSTFEAGAISKELNLKDSDGPDGRVWTYFLGLSDSEVKGPLGQFQHTRADKEETRRLVKSLHVMAQASLSPAEIDEEFEAKWPRLERKLKDIPDRGVTPRQSVKDMVGDLRQFMRWSQPVGITITSPSHGTKIKEQKIAMTGKAARTPAAGQIILPFVQHGEEIRPKVWVKAEASKEWNSDIWLMKKGKNTIHIVRPTHLDITSCPTTTGFTRRRANGSAS